MAARLRSITRQIHWSLALRAAVFALAWVWLPFWLFLIVSLYLYFSPLFRARALVVPFFTLLFLCYFQPPGTAFAVIFGAAFYFILVIKDLIVIDRRSAYELVVLVLAFLLLRSFYIKFNAGPGMGAFIYSAVLAGAFWLLLRSFILCFKDELVVRPGVQQVAVACAGLIFWQMLLVGLFLPLDFLYQTVVVFLSAVLLTDLLPAHLFGDLTRGKTLTAASAVLILFVFVLGSARWGL